MAILGGAPDSASRPQAVAAPPWQRFVGRQTLLDGVECRITALTDGLLIYDVQGVAGIGKTALLGELHRRLADAKLPVLSVSLADFATADDGAPEPGYAINCFRQIIEELQRQLPEGPSERFRMAVRRITRAARDGSEPEAWDELSDAFMNQIVGHPGPVISVLGDDIDSLLPGELPRRLRTLLRSISRVAPVCAVLTRSGAPEQSIAPTRRAPSVSVEPVTLGRLTDEEVAEMLRPGADVAEAIKQCGHYPGALAVALPALDTGGWDPNRIDPVAGQQLLDDLLHSLGGPVQQTAVEIAAVARRFQISDVRTVLADFELKAPPDLRRWLTGLPFVREDGDQPDDEDDTFFVTRPLLRRLLEDHLRTLPPHVDDSAENRLTELHARIADVQFERVSDYARHQKYSSWLRLETPFVQRALVEFAHHAFKLSEERRRYAVAAVFLDALWWWAEYLESVFSRQLLETCEGSAKASDREFLDALWTLQCWQPQGRAPDDASWDAAYRAITLVRKELGLDREAKQLDDDEAHVRAILDIYTGEYFAFRYPERHDADGHFESALELFARRRAPATSEDKDDSWCLPWVRYEQAKLAFTRDQRELATATISDAIREVECETDDESRDFEIEACLYRLLGDIRWSTKSRRTALRAYAKAVVAAYAFNGVPDPPDEYTRVFYCQSADHVIERVASLLHESNAEAVVAYDAFVALWQPYWERTKGQPGAFSALSDQRRTVLFPAEPRDEDLEAEDGPYVETVLYVYGQLKAHLDEALTTFGHDPWHTRTAAAARRGTWRVARALRRRAAVLNRVHRHARAAERPPRAKHYEWFASMTDAVWPDHWEDAHMPSRWRSLTEDDRDREDVKRAIEKVKDGLPESWREIVEAREHGQDYGKVTREHGYSRTHQAVCLHYVRAQVRREIDLIFRAQDADGEA